MFNVYKSPEHALTTAYRDVSWEKEKFIAAAIRPPAGYWKDDNRLLHALDLAAQRLGIEKVFLLNFIHLLI